MAVNLTPNPNNVVAELGVAGGSSKSSPEILGALVGGSASVSGVSVVVIFSMVMGETVVVAEDSAFSGTAEDASEVS